MAVKCPKCQAENTSDSQFCKKCAAPFLSEEIIDVTETIEAPKEELTRGTTLANRYEIIELKIGGMMLDAISEKNLWHRLFFILMACLLMVYLWGCGNPKEQTPGLEPPVAKVIPKELTIHGDTRVDNYFWLNQKENPEVIAYLEAENFFKAAVMQHTEDFQERLFQEIVGRIKKTDMSLPSRENGYLYYSRFEGDGEYPLYCRRQDSPEAEEEILLNVNEMAAGHSYYRASGLSVSPDNTLMAYGVDTVGSKIFTLHFMKLKTRELFPERIPNTLGRTVWANDNRAVFYPKKDKALRPYKIFRHILGTAVDKDVEVYHEADNTFCTYISKTKSKKYLIIGSLSTLSNEFRFLDAGNPQGEFRIIQPREKDLLYSVTHFGDQFYIRTNLDAQNFRLMKTPVEKTGKNNWVEVIPHREDVLLGSNEIFKEYLVGSERKAGIPNIRVIRWSDKSEYYLDFEEKGYQAYFSGNPEFDTDLLRFSYTSMTTPSSTFDFNMKTKEKILLKQQEVLGGFNPADYQAERIFATARDGTKVPISLVYRKGFEKNGTHPLLLYGYGSFAASQNPSFSTDRLSLLDRGFVYAIAHIRGGQEMGRWWYEDGKLLKKKNTFTDFIDCADFLIQEKYADPEKVFALGRSGGGLLMGAVVNMRPDLWKGMVASVPVVDLVTSMLDDSIPLMAGDWDEWGDPRDKEYYDYMLSYSPYDQVKTKNYPAMLVITGLHDRNVQFWEAAKWVAKLRALKTDDNLLLLHTNMDAGHGGQSGRFRAYRETALKYAFIFDLIGIKE